MAHVSSRSSSTTATTSRASSASRCAGGALALTLALGACGSDSATAPNVPAEPICCDDGHVDLSLNVPVIVEPIRDARMRVASNLYDARNRETLASMLGDLEAALRSGYRERARVRLVAVQDAVRQAQDRAARDMARDIPDLAAAHLALIPAAQALGITSR